MNIILERSTLVCKKNLMGNPLFLKIYGWNAAQPLATIAIGKLIGLSHTQTLAIVSLETS